MNSMRIRRPGGFTLIELLMVIAVITVALGLGVPAFKQTIAAQRVKTAAFDLFSALSYARSEAVTRNTTVSLKAGESSSGAWTTGWRVENSSGSVLRTWGSTNGLSITEAGSLTTVTFNNAGRLSTSAPKLQVGPTSSISGVSSRCISVELSGRPSTASGACS